MSKSNVVRLAAAFAAVSLLSSGRPALARLPVDPARYASFPAAPPKGSKQFWKAASTTALSITGDITLGPDQLIIGRKTFPLTLVRDIGKDQLANAGKIVDLTQAPSSARLYQTLISRRSTLLHSNTICGSDNDASWMLAVYDEGDLSVAFFSGVSEPNLDYKVVEEGHSLCGTYRYALPGK